MTPMAPKMPPLARSLSARLLILTVFFVMVAEVLIFAPSIARFQLDWFQEKISAAHLATLALEATPTNMVSEELEEELLRHVGAHGVIIYKPDTKTLMLSSDMPPRIDAEVDLAQMGLAALVGDSLSTLLRTDNRVLKVMGPSPQDPAVTVAVVVDEKPLCDAMFAYAERIFLLSIAISLFTAMLVYFSLQWLMVAPMRRITTSLIAFRDAPENPDAAATVSGRSDEIGIAEHELAAMQARLRAALRQKEHLAALGEAVTKINHDLRNMLATATLVSERLSESADPEVRRASDTIERAIGRAAALCTQTLNYAEDRPEPERARFVLADMLNEAALAMAPFADGDCRLAVDLPDGFALFADRDQMFRLFTNIARNAAEAGAKTVRVRLAPDVEPPSAVGVDIADDGPGMSDRAVENLFKPFSGSTRRGGTGLGLAIARDLAEAHGGSLALVRTGADGTVFRLVLPDGTARIARAAQ